MIDSDLTEEEKYLFALLMDESGVDHMEFLWADNTGEENDLFRTWPIQMAWWRTPGQKILSAGSRSIGKSLSILGRAFAFPFVMGGDEMVITAPDGDRLGAITDKVETLFLNNAIAEAMLAPGTRGRIKHRPFHISFANGARIMGRIPRLDGTGIQGTHPIWLEHDEACFSGDTLIYTIDGYKRIDQIAVGEYVLTHKNRWKKVTNVWNKGVRDTVVVKGQGHHGLRVTPNHKFWAKKVIKWKDTKNKWGVKELTDFNWIEAQDLNDSFWSSVISIPEVKLPNEIPKAQTGSSYAIDVLSNDFLWCLGLYMAEGSTSSSYGNGGKLNKVTWSIHKDEAPYVTFRLEAAGIKYFIQPVQNTKNCMNVVVASVNLASWIKKECGHGAHNKKIPSWVFSLDEGQRKMVFDGLIYGDGNINNDPRYADGACNYTTVSKSLAYDVKTLAQSLGLSTTLIYREGGEITIRDKQYNSGPSYSVRIGGNSGQGFYDEHLKLNKVKSISKADPIEVWDIEVEDDHSFVAESIVVHNSTYPERGWKEIVETVKIQNPKARWRCHGVTMGPGNTFDDKVSGNDPTWIVKKLPAMYRPNWTEKERQDKIIEYGGYESLDFKRNILGSAEGADSSLLVLNRLMACVDTDELSEFNMSEYYNVFVSDALLHEADDILDLVDPPISHTEYKKVWIGMDYGLTTSLSCILVFAEVQLPGEKFGRLKLVSKIMMMKIPTEQQVKVLKHLMFIYRPLALSFDAHGVGMPAFDWLQKEVREDPDVAWMLDRVKGYSFSENIIVDMDERIDINTNIPDDWERAAIVRKTSDHSLDILRLVVDTGKIWLPYDKEFIGELQAIPRKELMTVDEYGKPRRKKGQHMLDSFRFALLAWKQQPVDEVVNKYKDSWQPPQMMIMDYF